MILILAGLAIGAMALFPPWLYSYRAFGPDYTPQTYERPAGYHLVIGDHIPSDQTAMDRLFGQQVHLPSVSTRIDRGRLVVQIAGALIVGLLLALALHSWSPKPR